MAYEPTEWSTGDVVTAAALNKMEQGIASGGGAFIVDVVDPNLDPNQEGNDGLTKVLAPSDPSGPGEPVESIDAPYLSEKVADIFAAFMSGKSVISRWRRIFEGLVEESYMPVNYVFTDGDMTMAGFVFDGNMFGGYMDDYPVMGWEPTFEQDEQPGGGEEVESGAAR